MSQRKKIKPEYFSFTRKERVGIITVVVLMMVFLAIPFLYTVFHKAKPVDHKAFEKEIAELKVKVPDSGKGFTARNYEDYNNVNYYQPAEKKYNNQKQKGELFYFDPNTLSEEGWIKLGIREKTVKTIKNYISKGGRFYKPADIGKIWGLHEDEVSRLLPYVRIEAKPENRFSDFNNTQPEKKFEKSNIPFITVDVNNADTAAFIALPGIGSKLAVRIIAFREKLGGFYKIEQVAETYALPDSTFQKIKSRLVIASASVKKLNINTATADELKTHPYLRYNIANAIVQYRLQHGSFSSVSEIKKIMMITDDIYNKAVPYLTVK